MTRNLGELGLNLQKIVKRFLANQNLLKLLYYTGKDPLNEPDLDEETIKKEVYNKLVKVIPRVDPKETATSLIALRVVEGSINPNNNEFRDIEIAIEIFVPLTQWFIKDTNMRPFCIISEILNTINDKRINGLGRIEGGDFALNFLTDEISCYEMVFRITQYE